MFKSIIVIDVSVPNNFEFSQSVASIGPKFAYFNVQIKEQLIFDIEKLLSNRDELRGIRENFETFGEKSSRQKLAELDQNDPKPLIFTKPC